MESKLLKHGAFSWFELMTSDVGRSKEFYTRLFNWTTEKMEMEGGMTYNVVKVGNEEVGGIMATPPRAGDMPSMWSIYVTVDDVDETAQTVGDLGGQVLMGPRDIPNVGRFCVIQDPQGAVISVITYKPM